MATRDSTRESRPKTLKFFCRCGQKVRVTFPAPRPTGKCPRCGHEFEVPALPEEGKASQGNTGAVPSGS